MWSTVQIKLNTKMKIIVKGAEKFLDMKDLSWEQINRRLEEVRITMGRK